MREASIGNEDSNATNWGAPPCNYRYTYSSHLKKNQLWSSASRFFPIGVNLNALGRIPPLSRLHGRSISNAPAPRFTRIPPRISGSWRKSAGDFLVTWCCLCRAIVAAMHRSSSSGWVILLYFFFALLVNNARYASRNQQWWTYFFLDFSWNLTVKHTHISIFIPRKGYVFCVFK